MNNKAQDVLKQIRKLYTYKGELSVNHSDIQKHLMDDRVDNFVACVHKHRGYDRSFDNAMTAFYYSDGSILVVNSNGGMNASKFRKER